MWLPVAVGLQPKARASPDVEPVLLSPMRRDAAPCARTQPDLPARSSVPFMRPSHGPLARSSDSVVKAYLAQQVARPTCRSVLLAYARPPRRGRGEGMP